MASTRYCGDRLTLYLHFKDGVITDASFMGTGCAISTASASLMTEYLKGKTINEAERLFHDFHQMLTQDTNKASSQLGNSKYYLAYVITLLA